MGVAFGLHLPGKNNESMNKLLLFLSVLMISATSYAQIVLEQTYPASAALTQLSVSGSKYYLMDIKLNQCQVYNMDHSLWKTVNLSIPANNYLYDVKYVSEGLFNTDNKVELAYIYYSYDTTSFYYTYNTRVIDENGNELISIPGCAYISMSATKSNGVKMLAYIYNYSVYPSTVSTQVYSIPGSLQNNAIAPGEVSNDKLPFPNPAGSSVTIPVQFPDGINEGEVRLFDADGRNMRTYPINRTFDHVMIRFDDIPRGIYFYQVKSGPSVLGTGRVVHE